MKKRKDKIPEVKDTKARTNRTYEDFQKYIEKHPELPILEMDTVEGIKSGRVLLTDINLMINHINSLGRTSLNWFVPIDVAKFTMERETLKKLNLKKIPTDEIQLTKNLLKKN